MTNQLDMSVNNFDVWFDNVVSEASLIASPETLTRAWLHGEKSLTSAYDVEELLEQLLGDLHLEDHLGRFQDDLSRVGALATIAPFVRAVLELEDHLRSDPSLQNPATLLVSLPWRELVHKAACFVASSAAEHHKRA